ncbi:MAG: PhoU domain-containing protein [Candidatus Omnitrophica bacterium]|jgi:phosphate:Na+ symporter|nr:PhoU domain-containing protein [Candidatus Omnitrophota bacterium]
MDNLSSVKEQLNQMGHLALSMLKDTFAGFMEHDRDILAVVLKNEQKLNDTEKSIATYFAGISKTDVNTQDKKNIMRIANIALDLEQIGDYIKDMVERIEIKIEEKLLFDDDAVNEYKHLYSAVEAELDDVVKALDSGDKNFAKRILGDERHVDRLAKKYRDSHTKRLFLGVCEPRSCNMFLNLLDFTAQISHHTKAVAKSLLLIK